MLTPLKRLALIATTSAALLLASCAESPYDDAHAAPRQTQAWENLDLSTYDQSQLLAHLATLNAATAAAAAAGQSVEFHHLEIALTATLEALEKKATGNAPALDTISKLKPLAIQLHEAGHDANLSMGLKLNAVIANLTARLATQLQKS